MKCPECGSDQRVVINSRVNKTLNMRGRRYECLDCGYRWSTVEILRTDYDNLKALSVGLKNMFK